MGHLLRGVQYGEVLRHSTPQDPLTPCSDAPQRYDAFGMGREGPALPLFLGRGIKPHDLHCAFRAAGGRPLAGTNDPLLPRIGRPRRSRPFQEEDIPTPVAV